uniref:RRM domain-containing protein n=1 Tax=Salix viminalis TaxID=40686 RepID=A0A6N2M752_SALVM
MAEAVAPWKQQVLQRGASLYVGDLDPEVTETDLRAAFYHVGPISSLRLCRCCLTGKSLCYSYVNFYSRAQASRALGLLNHTNLKGKPMRIMWCQRDPFSRKTGFANLFVKNLDFSISSSCLESIFSMYGTILSCKVAEENGRSKGFGFVQFDSQDSALAAQTALHDTMLGGKKLYVCKFVKKTERREAAPCEVFTNLYVKNLDETMTEDGLKDMFSVIGDVSSAAIMMDHEGKSKGFGFVNFKSPDDAKKAVDVINGSVVGSKTLFVGKAQRKSERKMILKQEYKDYNRSNEKLRASNLYVKNLNVDIDDKRLEEVFSAYGKILSAKVMCHNDGTSRQFGFVCFASPEEANKALVALHGVLLEGKILHVAKAQCKKDHHQERHNFSEQNQPQFFYPSNCNIVSSAIHPLHFNFDRPPQLPFLHRPMFCQQFGANFGVQHPFMPQIYQQKFSTYMPTAEIFLGSKFNTRDKPYQQHSLKFATSNFSNRDLKLGSAGGQKLDSKKKGGKRGAAGENISTGSPSTKCLPAAKSTDSTVINFGNLLQPIVKKLQETHQKALGNDQIECH